MKFLKKLLKVLVVLFGLLIATLYITDTDYLIKAVRTIYMRGYTTAFLDDYKKFDNQEVKNGTPQPWPNHKDYNSVKETSTLDKANKDWGTADKIRDEMKALGIEIKDGKDGAEWSVN